MARTLFSLLFVVSAFLMSGCGKYGATPVAPVAPTAGALLSAQSSLSSTTEKTVNAQVQLGPDETATITTFKKGETGDDPLLVEIEKLRSQIELQKTQAEQALKDAIHGAEKAAEDQVEALEEKFNAAKSELETKLQTALRHESDVRNAMETSLTRQIHSLECRVEVLERAPKCAPQYPPSTSASVIRNPPRSFNCR